MFQVTVITSRSSGWRKQLTPADASSGVKSFLLQVTLHPGDVIIEGTVRHSPLTEEFQVNLTQLIVQNINLYFCMRISVVYYI